MLNLVSILIAIDCVLLMLVVLIQNPKGGGVDSTFGGASATQMFGAAGSADFIEKTTWYLAAALFILCIVAVFIAGTGAPDLTPIVPDGTTTPTPAQ
ncbi:MAG: preprotein translocase subunit SecG [Saprospiraceae bacterium]|nr:preprotein translocase subunit SecG [Saprospiraceae bacterium]